MIARHDELDRADLFGGAVRCWQFRRGYRFNVDALLLAMAAFDPPSDATRLGPAGAAARDGSVGFEESVVELGTGVGVVLLVLALNPRFRRLVGLELQPALAALARRNVDESGARGLITIVEGDLRDPPPPLNDERFDLVVSNPPYYPVAEGHLNPDSQRAVARHEVACRLQDVLTRARASVRTSGRVVLVYPAPRATALIDSAPGAGLAVSDLRYVRSRPDYTPRQILATLRPHDGPAPPPPVRSVPTLDLHDANGVHVGPLADFFRRIERLATLRDRDE